MICAVIFLWAGCLYSMFRSVLCLLWIASPARRLLVLAVLLLTAFYAHKPQTDAKPPA